MTQQDDKSDKVVNLAQVRKKQRTVQERSKPKPGSDGYEAALRKQKQPGQGGSNGSPSLGQRLGNIVQFLLFLGVCYLFLRTCNGI